MSESKQKAGRKAKAAGGLIALTGGTLLAGVGAAAPALAATNASGCTGMPNGVQCMVIHGTGQTVTQAHESASRVLNPGEICNYKAKWRGDNVKTGWTTYTHPEVRACSIEAAFINWKNGTKRFKKNTWFYGYWESKSSGGWTNPVKEKIR
jgi:hypothetical protein